MPDWKLGQRCVITDTANVLSRCPELVGSIGEITGLPTATSHCYDVAVTDGRVIKFQPSALQAASTGRAAAAAAFRATDDGDESDEEALESKVSHAQSLKRGTQVTIHRTENVQQRAPHLIGRVGTIKEVPTHPNTWFKVQFADRRVCTFRPSALRRVATGARPGAKPGGKGGPELSDEEEAEAKPRGKRQAAQLLSSVLTGRAVDAEQFVGTHVRIRVGRLGGQVGRILRSGNGWVQLRTQKGEIAKRAYELEIV
eukprot:CAMPEP_0119276288 /NCGR_PEP_ID=MMETSP1329-20130426/15161_1 /TAXON_ID=114041 /ORGANISM="Genus nov. species nov., Strain RCC1024" /LENGTH=255 /DNA_ID=CAMNT_0007276717 /DNA_START=291 /DNA_END=1055 /DNA_ORIENTATION=+